MQIHRVKEGESIYSIAREYGVHPSKIIENNGIRNPSRLTVGRELLILIPTRTYTARRGDSIESISRRFSISRKEINRNNPYRMGSDKIYPEEVFALKYPQKEHGILLLNGYLFKGCPESAMKRTLPYLSHITASVGFYEKGRLCFAEDIKSIAKYARENEKTPLLRIYPKETESYFSENLILQSINAAKSNGYSGITLPIPKGIEESKLSELFLSFKKAALAEGLSLNTETDSVPCEKILSLSDSTILTADDGFRKDANALSLYRDYAKAGEAISSFIDLSPFAYLGTEAMPIDDALYLADRDGIKIIASEDGMNLSFKIGSKEVVMPSLKNIKAKLDLIGELGYLGCSIDIMRCPVSHLMMLSSAFSLSPDYFSGGI